MNKCKLLFKPSKSLRMKRANQNGIGKHLRRMLTCKIPLRAWLNLIYGKRTNCTKSKNVTAVLVNCVTKLSTTSVAMPLRVMQINKSQKLRKPLLNSKKASCVVKSLPANPVSMVVIPVQYVLFMCKLACYPVPMVLLSLPAAKPKLWWLQR